MLSRLPGSGLLCSPKTTYPHPGHFLGVLMGPQKTQQTKTNFRKTYKTVQNCKTSHAPPQIPPSPLNPHPPARSRAYSIRFVSFLCSSRHACLHVCSCVHATHVNEVRLHRFYFLLTPTCLLVAFCSSKLPLLLLA